MGDSVRKLAADWGGLCNLFFEFDIDVLLNIIIHKKRQIATTTKLSSQREKQDETDRQNEPCSVSA